MPRLPLVMALALALPGLASASPALVLREDPPLPGQSLDGWEALAPAGLSDEPTLDVDEVVAIALAYAPAVRLARSGVEAARGELLSARAIANPTWEIDLYGADGEGSHTGFRGGEVEFDLTHALLAPARVAGAAPDVDAARLLADDAAVRAAYEARAAWFDLKATTAAWEASLRAVDGLAASRDTARALVAAGNASARDLAVREAAYEDARLRAAGIELAKIASEEHLRRILGGTEPGRLAPLAPAPETLSLPDDVEGLAVAASFERRALEEALEAAHARTVAARWEGLSPDLDLFVEAERHGEGLATTAGIGVTLPLFAFGTGEVVKASAERDALATRLDAASIDAASAAREARARLESAHLAVRHHLEVRIPAAERVLSETLLHYDAMQIGIDTLLDAWLARLEADVAYAYALRDFWTAQAAFDAVLAGSRVELPVSEPAAARRTQEGGH